MERRRGLGSPTRALEEERHIEFCPLVLVPEWQDGIFNSDGQDSIPYVLLASSLLLLTCAGTAVPISSADAKGDMRMVIFLYAMSREMSWTLRIFLALGQFS